LLYSQISLLEYKYVFNMGRDGIRSFSEFQIPHLTDVKGGVFGLVRAVGLE